MRFIDCINITGESCKAYKGNKEYISTGAVDVDHIDRNQIEIVNYDSKPSRANLITDDKSILFAKMQGTKKVLLIDQELDKNIYSTGFFSIAPKQNVLKKECLYYLLGSKTFLSQKDKYCTGATQKSITLEGLKKIEITVPNLEEQDRIVKILDTINNILESYKKELENYDRLVKARFVEMFGDLKINEKRWNSKTFEEMSVLITDGEHATPRRTTEGIYLLSARNVLNHSFQLEDVDYIDQEEYDRIARRIVPKKGDVLVSCSGTVGRCCSVPPNFKFQMVRSVALIRFNDEINPLFAEYMIASDYIQEQINRCKTISSQANLFQGKIKMLRGFIPPIELQNEFADFVKQVDKSKLAIQKSLDKLEILKNSLMQKYFG